MSIRHSVGYSKSTRAKCHALPLCRGTLMPPGTLRYGQVQASEFGETVEWRHWGCITPAILRELAQMPVTSLEGYNDLEPSDKQKVKTAISRCSVDPTDIPVSARPKPIVSQRPPAPLTATVAPTQGAAKRTATMAGLPEPSQKQILQGEEGEEDTEDEPDSRDELYCTMQTSVVGIQYYNGLVGPNEEVILVREPHNRYDSNAIQVKNISRVQVGHLPRQVVSKLAPLLDRQAVTVEGVMSDGNLGRSSSKIFTLAMSLKIYGPANKRAVLEPALIWATPGQCGFPQSRASASTGAPSTASSSRAPVRDYPLPLAVPQMTQTKQSPAQQEALRKQQEALQKAAELRQMLNNLEKVDDEGRRTGLLDTLCSVDDVLTLPLYPNPPGIQSQQLTVDLLKHQVQALQWCVERENPVLPQKEADKPVQFWQLRKNGAQSYYFNLATKTPQQIKPVLGRGALCADAMGLGKTLTMISLVLATKKQVDPGYTNATLIVVPVSVLSNWEKQINDHCTEGAISYAVYYGPKKGQTASELPKYDIVITTYTTVSGEHEEDTSTTGKKKRKVDRALFNIKWKRVILDEGHTIRNPKTKIAKACTALDASRRWVLSGTPIINSPRDLGSILSFLRICQPLDNEDLFKRLLLRPLKNGEVGGAELLKALMGQICLRRTKEMQSSDGTPIISLPPVEMIRVPVTISDEARVLYDEVEQLSQQRVMTLMRQGVTASIQSNVLSLLTRMRQISLHPGLVPASYLEELKRADAIADQPHPTQAVTPAQRIDLQYRLAQGIEDCEECPICFSVLANDARITTCSHMYCLACIMEALSRDAKCPLDRRTLSAADLHEAPPPTELTQKAPRTDEHEGFETRTGSSAKIDQLIHMLKLTPEGEKSLVFSQFTGFLDKIGEALDAANIPYVRFDGKMSAKRRQEAIAEFSVPLEASGKSSTTEATTDGSDDDLEDPFPSRRFNSLTKTNPRVMLLSLKAGALGLNLTVANNVYLMDPWWQEGIESQAVDRVNRIGQKKNVHVYQLIAENTVEAKVLEIQERKKQLIQHAFPGIKGANSRVQQREARLQDIIELFGMRRQTQESSA